MSQLHHLLILQLLFPLLPTLTLARDRHVIKFRSPSLYPEGLTWDPSSQHFIVASLRGGTFHSVSDAGVVETLTLTNTAALPPETTFLGLAVDHRHRRLLAAVNTPSPHLAAFDLRHHRSSLPLLSLSPLPQSPTGGGVANDVTFDPYGNAYVSNSGNNLIWKVDLTTSTTTTTSIFSNSTLFTHYDPVDRDSPYNYCGLNGVVYIPTKQFILSVQTNTGKMFKIDTVDGTARTVNLPAALPLADGIAVRDDGIVVVVSMNRAWLLKSDDNWISGVVIDEIALDREGFPTSVTVGGGGRVYVIYGYVEEGMKGISQEREWFRIEEIRSGKESGEESAWPFGLIGLGLGIFCFWRFQMRQLVSNMDKKRA